MTDFMDDADGCDNCGDCEESATAPGLPEFCYAIKPDSGQTVMIKRGQKGYWPASHIHVNAANTQLGVTPAQVEAMIVGSMFSWKVNGADPEYHRRQGLK
jgi:hypothetical protein